MITEEVQDDNRTYIYSTPASTRDEYVFDLINKVNKLIINNHLDDTIQVVAVFDGNSLRLELTRVK